MEYRPREQAGAIDAWLARYEAERAGGTAEMVPLNSVLAIIQEADNDSATYAWIADQILANAIAARTAPATPGKEDGNERMQPIT